MAILQIKEYGKANSQNWPLLGLNFKEHKADENQQYTENHISE